MIYSESEWEMLAENEGLIKAVIAREKQHILALHLPLMEFDDLFSIGKFGMIRAIHAHKADRGALSTVCSHAISNEISNEVKRQFRAGREPKTSERALSIDKIHEDGCRALEAQLYHERMSVEDIAEVHRTFDIALELCKQGILRASDAKAWAAYMYGSTYASIGKAMGLTTERIRQKVERANAVIREYVNGKSKEHWQKAVSAGKYAMYAGRAIMLDKCSPEKVCGKWRFTARKNEIEPLDKNMRYDLDKMMRNAILYKDGNLYRVSWLGIRWLERITGLEIVEKKERCKKVIMVVQCSQEQSWLFSFEVCNMNIIDMDISRIKPYEKNAKKHDDTQISNGREHKTIWMEATDGNRQRRGYSYRPLQI